TKNKVNRLNEQTGDQKLIAGLQKHSATLPSLMIGGTSYPTDTLVATLQSRLATAAAVASTRATWQTAVQADRDERTKTQTVVSGVRQALHVAFAGSVSALADFGLTPRKPAAPRTPEQKAASVAKAKATRAARNTMGSNQKKAVKGNVTGVNIVPVVAETPATPPAHPASPAPAAAAPATAPRAS
ncbi:MAG TPA: hypothetical protein VKU41_25305, partial [Polyangiaceae bacterium]|nr:hypothetical protein [Polyangiaceae bacterium]